MSKKFLLIVIGIVTAAPAQEAGQNATDSSRVTDYELAPIIVTATRAERARDRVPYALGVIEQKDIQRAEIGLSLDEALRAIPGVVVNNRFNLSQGDRLSIRGLGSRAPFGVRGLKIILDGIPLTMADGQSQLNNLDLGSVGKIEILRGPSSSLYGNAAGGLIDIHTETAANSSLQFRPQMTFGAFGLRKWQGKASGQIGRQAYLLNLSHLQLDGYREHSAAQSTAFNVVSHRKLSHHLKLSVVFNYFDAPYLLNPSSLSKTDAEKSPAATRFFVKQQGAGKRTRQGQGGLTFKHAGAASRFEATVFGLTRALFNPLPGRIIELDRTAGGIRAVYNKRWQIGQAFLSWTAGADYERQHDSRVEFENHGLANDQIGVAKNEDILKSVRYGARLLDQKENVVGIGVFSELEFSPHSNWMFTLGGRYDRYRFDVADRFLSDGVDDSGARRMEKFSPLLGVVYRIHAFISFYGNLATAFQTPTTTELSNQPAREGGLHPTLQPERITSYEFGLKGSWPKIHCHYEAAFYRFRVKDMLIPYQIAGRAGEEIFYRNAGRARNKGFEAGLQWTPFKSLRAAGAYAFMNFVFEDFPVETITGNTVTPVQLAGKKVPGVPAHRFFASLLYEHQTGAFAEVDLQYVDRYFTSDFNGPPPSGNKPLRDFMNAAYRTVDVRAGFQPRFKNFRADFFVGVNNLFDERYNGSIVPNAAADRFFEPAAGRTWYVKSEIHLLNVVKFDRFP
ncbi:MAG: TonB-dependent receptor [candidate division KSB1 bacterium]|nr:TonB-dependent receptor [candidate division KSB1 bacterium]MDZ7366667.1 TonB-dependent receptor [candidate division KSB1 bacterium]MDZ7404677.1 TonB-dependent receptor [candidate division KSB1 bacterium]